MKRGIRQYLCALCLLILVVGCTTTGSKQEINHPPLSAKEVYDRISPSLAFVYTPLGSGSGALTQEGYILTNAHVVYPYKEVGVTFPHGTALESVPVAFIDLIGDFALLGPVSVDAPAITFVPREDLEIGSDVYLIGYPVETEALPEPTITKGILSRIREWTTIELTYFQTDAAIAGGQSGGVLVSDRGEVVGISSLSTAWDNFALAASVEDVVQRLEQMTAGVDVAGLGSRWHSFGEKSRNHEINLENLWASGVFAAVTDPGSVIDLTARSDQDIALYILDRYGDTLGSADDYEGGMMESLRVETQQDFHYIMVEPTVEGSGTVSLQSNQPLASISDPDDSRSLEVGKTYTANMDFPFDCDWFTVQLLEGQKVTVEVESVMIDPYVYIDLEGVPTPVEDDDSGGGVLGLNSRLTFQATRAGEHILAVLDSEGYWTGGYIIEISEASPGTVAQTFAEADRLPEAELDTQKQQEDAAEAEPGTERQWRRYFDIVPKGWTIDTEFFQQSMGAQVDVRFGGGLATAIGYDPNVTVVLIPVPKGATASRYVDHTIDGVKKALSGTKVVAREPVTVDSVTGERVEMIVENQMLNMQITQIYLFRENELWLLQGVWSVDHKQSALCYDLIHSFHFPEDALLEGGSFDAAGLALGFLDRIERLYEAGDMKKAEEQLEVFSRLAESLDPEDSEYAETITAIGVLHQLFGHNDLSVEYLDRAEAAFDTRKDIEKLGRFLNNTAWDFYMSGMYEAGEPLARRSVSICSSTLGSDNSLTNAAKHTLAMLLVGLGQYQEAESLLHQALAYQEQTEGLEHEVTVGYLTDLLTLLTRAGKEAEAGEIFSRISSIRALPPEWASVGGVLPAER